MKNAINFSLLITTVAVLAACGGGGGDGGETAAAVDPAEARRAEEIKVAIADAQTKLTSIAKDPASVQFQNMKAFRVDTDMTICGEYNAKNSLGGYVGFKPFYSRVSAPFVLYGRFETDVSKDRELYNATCSEKPSVEVDAIAKKNGYNWCLRKFGIINAGLCLDYK
jgi:hypothetical protein